MKSLTARNLKDDHQLWECRMGIDVPPINLPDRARHHLSPAAEETSQHTNSIREGTAQHGPSAMGSVVGRPVDIILGDDEGGKLEQLHQ
jgi:hypothetical protein